MSASTSADDPTPAFIPHTIYIIPVYLNCMHLPAVTLILTGKNALLFKIGASSITLVNAGKLGNEWQSNSETINKQQRIPEYSCLKNTH